MKKSDEKDHCEKNWLIFPLHVVAVVLFLVTAHPCPYRRPLTHRLVVVDLPVPGTT